MYNRANIYKAMHLPNAEIELIKTKMSYHEYKMGKARDEGNIYAYRYHSELARKHVREIAKIMKQEV